MFEIKFWGRGGQGNYLGLKILGEAAIMVERYLLTAPMFGAERTGAPVSADFRINDSGDQITARYPITTPDCIVFSDEGLITAERIQGLKDNGWLIINSAKPPEDFFHLGPFEIATVDAKKIAAKYGIGTIQTPITNTTILGAVIKVLKPELGMTLKILCRAIKAVIGQTTKLDNNIAAAKEAFAQVIVKTSTNSIRIKPLSPPPTKEVDPILLEWSKKTSISLYDTTANLTGPWSTVQPEIDPQKCLAGKCGKKNCIDLCPDAAVSIQNGKITIDYNYCKGCGLCAKECPCQAIRMRPKAELDSEARQ